MTLWIDADAAPRDVKDICFRASERLTLATVLVANQRIQLPPGYRHLSAVRVDGGPDVADRYIAEHAVAGDVAVTADIPLAALLVPKGVVVLDPRGDEYTAETCAYPGGIDRRMFATRTVARARRSDARKQTSFTGCGAASASIQSVITTRFTESRQECCCAFRAGGR